MMIPFLHPYLALEWHRGDVDYPGQLGEVRGSQRVAGFPDNPRYLGTQFLGTEDDWCGLSAYPEGFAVEVDAEGCPVDCVELALGHDGHYQLEVRQERTWDALVRHGPRLFGSWNQERSWGATVKTTSHYTSSWRREHRWDGLYETTDHFTVYWRQERSWDAVVKTTAHYTSSWGREHTWPAVYETTDHFTVEWDQERRWQATVKTLSHEVAAWNQERSWDAVVKTTAHYTSSWGREHTWPAVYETTDHFTVEWDQERRWQATVKTLAHHTAAWNQERSWGAVVTTSAHYTSSWNREHSWDAVCNTVDNMTTFTCGAQVAAGSNQSGATAITFDKVSLTSTGAGQGARLPAQCVMVTVRNDNAGGGNNILIYPPTGAKLGTQATNGAIGLTPGQSILFSELTGTQWDYIILT